MVKLLLCIFFKRMTLIDVLINIIFLIWLSKCIWLVCVSSLPIIHHYLWLFYLGRRWKPWTSHTHTYVSKHSEPNIPQKFQKVLFIYFEPNSRPELTSSGTTPSQAPWQRASTIFTCTPLDLNPGRFSDPRVQEGYISESSSLGQISNCILSSMGF